MGGIYLERSRRPGSAFSLQHKLTAIGNKVEGRRVYSKRPPINTDSHIYTVSYGSKTIRLSIATIRLSIATTVNRHY